MLVSRDICRRTNPQGSASKSRDGRYLPARRQPEAGSCSAETCKPMAGVKDKRDVGTANLFCELRDRQPAVCIILVEIEAGHSTSKSRFLQCVRPWPRRRALDWAQSAAHAGIGGVAEDQGDTAFGIGGRQAHKARRCATSPTPRMMATASRRSDRITHRDNRSFPQFTSLVAEKLDPPD